VSHEWLIDSLSEIKAVAAAHDLPLLVEQLEIALQIAHLETAQDQPVEPRRKLRAMRSD